MTATRKIIAIIAGVLLSATVAGVGIDAYSTNQAEKNSIGQQKALETALREAGLLAEKTSDVRVKLDKDDGIWVYEVEFYADGLEYDFSIDSVDGRVIKKEIDGRKVSGEISQRQSSEQQSLQQSGQTENITLDKAKEIALQAAGVDSANAQFSEEKLSQYHGRTFYEMEFYSDGYEYDYKIAMDGQVMEAEKEKKNEDVFFQPASLIGVDKAKRIALEHSNVSEEVFFEKAKLEKDDGRTYYEIEFKAGLIEYEYDIDAVTGDVIDFDMGNDD